MSVEEIEFGDNDTLSALVARLVDAELLVIMTDIDGLYDKNPSENSDCKLISVVKKIDDELKAAAGGAGSRRGTGGMITKLTAAEIAGESGIKTVICKGDDPKIIYDVLDGEDVGTIFI